MFSADGLDSLEESLKVLGLNSDAATLSSSVILGQLTSLAHASPAK